MAKRLSMVVLAGLLVASTAARADWHQGGTLQESTMSEWFAATPENRLATAADLVVMLRNKPHQAFSSIEEMRPYAEDLDYCIGETGKDPAAGQEPVLRIAMLCAVLYAWR